MNITDRSSERGSAGVKLVFVLLVVGLVFNAGYNYVPVAYQAESLKQELQTSLLKSVSLPAINKTPTDLVKESVTAAVRAADAPADTFIEIKPVKNAVHARVYYKKKVDLLPFGLYRYEYVFDHTATPTGLLTQN